MTPVEKDLPFGVAMKAVRFLLIWLLIVGSLAVCQAEEKGAFRLLSISESEKLILVSKTADKSKYLLDAAAAKITVNGKPAEINELESFTVIQVRWKKKESKRNGVRLDGLALEIAVEPPKKPE